MLIIYRINRVCFIYCYTKIEKSGFFAKKIFLFFMYIPLGGYIYLFAIYVVVDVIYMCELNKQKAVTIAAVTAHMTLYSHVV